MTLTPEQQQAADAYVNAAAEYYTYAASRPPLDTVEAIEANSRTVDDISTRLDPLWVRCLELNVPVPILDAAIEQRYGVKVDRRG